MHANRYTIVASLLVLAALMMPAALLAEDDVVTPEPVPTVGIPQCQCPTAAPARFGYSKPEDSLLCRLWADENDLARWNQFQGTRGVEIQMGSGSPGLIKGGLKFTDYEFTRRWKEQWLRREISECPAELWK